MAGNARDVELSIVGHDRTRAATDSAGRNFDRLKRKVDDLDGANARLTVGSKGAERGIAGMADSLVGLAATIRSAGPIAAVAAIAVAIAALPAVAAVASAGIVTALGGGLAALGIWAASQNAAVRGEFTRTAEHVKAELTRMAAPFEPVLIKIARKFRETFDYFRPYLAAAFAALAPVVGEFAGQIMESFKELAPAIKPVVDAFTAILRNLGPALPGMMRQISEGIIAVADAIGENPQAFTSLMQSLAGIVAGSLQVIAALTRAKAWMDANSDWLDPLAAGVAAAVLPLARLTMAVQGASGSVGTAMRRISDATSTTLSTVRGIIPRLNAAIRSLVGKAVDVIVNLPGVAAVSGVIARINGAIRTLAGKAVDVIVRLPGVATVAGIIAGLNAAIQRLVGKVVDVVVNLPGVSTIRDTVGGILGQIGRLGFDSGSTWSAVDSAAVHRVGGPAPVTVSAGPVSVDSRVYLDGQHFEALARTVVSQEGARQAWRARTGRR